MRIFVDEDRDVVYIERPDTGSYHVVHRDGYLHAQYRVPEGERVREWTSNYERDEEVWLEGYNQGYDEGLQEAQVEVEWELDARYDEGYNDGYRDAKEYLDED